MLSPWLKFFRVRNLITVPGDVLVGVAAVLFVTHERSSLPLVSSIVAASLSGVLLYMFGLADNDIVGAKTDPATRPLVSGEISPRAAEVARALCLGTVFLVSFFLGLQPLWALTMAILVAAIVIYNRTKYPILMGLCRGLNVLCGAAAVADGSLPRVVAIPAVVWTVYIAGVTKYSEREVFDPTNDHKVALLVYGLMGLQAVALVIFLLLGL